MPIALVVVVAVLAVIALVLRVARARFDRASRDQIDALLAGVPAGPGAIVQVHELTAVPAPVARWLTAAGVVGRPRARTVRLRQRGSIRTAVDAPWLPAVAVQYFAIDAPGFVWTIATRMKRVLPIVGRDSYAAGAGRMRIDVAALVAVVDAAGPAIDEGALLRFLAESVWFPSAALAPYVTWTAIDDHAARATMRDRGLTASVTFRFDDLDRVVRLEADRYLGGGADARREPWVIVVTGWGRFDGVALPTTGEVTWALAAGTFSYYRWQVTALAYDRRARWPS